MFRNATASPRVDKCYSTHFTLNTTKDNVACCLFEMSNISPITLEQRNAYEKCIKLDVTVFISCGSKVFVRSMHYPSAPLLDNTTVT